MGGRVGHKHEESCRGERGKLVRSLEDTDPHSPEQGMIPRLYSRYCTHTAAWADHSARSGDQRAAILEADPLAGLYEVPVGDDECVAVVGARVEEVSVQASERPDVACTACLPESEPP